MKNALPKVLIIIPTWNHLEATTKPCVEAVLRYSGEHCRIVCVDNASQDGTPEFLAETAGRDLRLSWINAGKNLGWAGGSLLGLRELRHDEDYFCLLNSDTIVTPGWLEKMIFHMERHAGLAMAIPNEFPDTKTPLEAQIKGVPGEGTAPGPPPLTRILRVASEMEKRHAGESRPCAPSGFCVLIKTHHCASVRAYLRDFDRMQSKALDWQAFFAEHGLTCRVALDTYVFHARCGSGGYDGYRR
jgi:GT2 family glycosyltransferase